MQQQTQRRGLARFRLRHGCKLCGWRRAEADGLCIDCGIERLHLTLLIARALARQGEQARCGKACTREGGR